MSDNDLGITVPSTSEETSPAEAPIHNETNRVGNPTSTRDELWVVVSDPEATREVSASRLAGLMYRSHEGWSRYVFHENDPHPQERSGK